MVVAEALAEKAAEATQPSAPARPVFVNEFVNDDGILDLAALYEALDVAPVEVDVQRYHQELAKFVGFRVEEIRVVQAFHMMPDNKPWCEQPWWKTSIWMRHLAGEEAGRKEKNG